MGRESIINILRNIIAWTGFIYITLIRQGHRIFIYKACNFILKNFCGHPFSKMLFMKYSYILSNVGFLEKIKEKSLVNNCNVYVIYEINISNIFCFGF